MKEAPSLSSSDTPQSKDRTETESSSCRPVQDDKEDEEGLSSKDDDPAGVAITKDVMVGFDIAWLGLLELCFAQLEN